MESHSIILSTPKINIPDSQIFEFVEDLINSNLTNIDYFGVEMDNQVDYFDFDDTMKRIMENTTYINISFQTEQSFNYEQYTKDEIFDLYFSLLERSEHTTTQVDEKDIDIFIC